ncbi:MAG TPA: GH92 family glycosyl hydrolase [Puia sp.]|nr:GH92 family glycosyl hydrolase [Puia sp.]
MMRYFIRYGWLLLMCQLLQAQSPDPLGYVDPFIGATRSNVFTRWGNEGGTYPGAVAPWGAMQLTPETKVSGGYDHKDSTICFFSCYHHMSGYPSGSAGRMKIMPLVGADGGAGMSRTEYGPGGGTNAGRPFRHADEKAMPGYYRVRLSDDGTIVETTASERAGVFRISFPVGVPRRIFIGGMRANTALQFNRSYVKEQVSKEGMILRFSEDTGAIVIRVSVSSVGGASAQKNIAHETDGLTFDEVRTRTQAAWRRQLSVIEVDDPDEAHKKIFYTALYHSMLLPWIISDVDGQYRGQDGAVHTTRGQYEYGGFSAWDTFRSLHPLLCLLFPDRQKDMVLSMMDVYRQTGYLPSDPMTGNHAAVVIADSWAKGIRGFDSAEAYAAMRKGVMDTPYRQKDMEVYRRLGYIPSTYPESVTRTVEYAYDDWVISEFDKRETRIGYNYEKLFDPASLFILPEGGERGNSGYKEGDKWVYSYFVPQDPFGLINQMGGDGEFTTRLDGALQRQDILFDNETVLHIPYLFGFAGRPDKTADWVYAIREGRYSATPGGLPGNDDLGAMSSWYVFSALGFYPDCPGMPDYEIGTPLFRKVILHLDSGDVIIRSPGLTARNRYVRRISFDGAIVGTEINHDDLKKAKEIVFEMDSVSGYMGRLWKTAPDFVFRDISVSPKKVASNELFRVRWTIEGHFSTGTKIVRLKVNGKRYAAKNTLVRVGTTVTDSMDCRLYALGKARLEIEGEDYPIDVKVVKEGDVRSEVSDVFTMPLIREGGEAKLSFAVRNIGGIARTIVTPVKVDDKIVRVDSSWLTPGASKKVFMTLPAFPMGWRELRVGDREEKFNVYGQSEKSLLLDLSADGKDRSGFGHDGKSMGKGPLFGKDYYIEVPGAPALDSMGETMTMMLWVYPTEKGENLVDIFAKGDNHVLQVGGNRSLTFFAGGWGRGDCTVDLPSDWWGHWHHIAGVCEGAVLKVYIDGELKGTSTVDGRANLSVTNRWTVGRNEEFPGQRVFNGYIDRARVFTEPLTGEEIRRLYQSSGAPPFPPR